MFPCEFALAFSAVMNHAFQTRQKGAEAHQLLLSLSLFLPHASCFSPRRLMRPFSRFQTFTCPHALALPLALSLPLALPFPSPTTGRFHKSTPSATVQRALGSRTEWEANNLLQPVRPTAPLPRCGPGRGGAGRGVGFVMRSTCYSAAHRPTAARPTGQ